MEDPSQSMIFKILNGPQNGVEVALEAGEYSIGNDRDDDLQITDVALSSKHGRLRIADGRISISAGSGSISTSTGLMLGAGDAAWHDIDQLDVVTIGSTRFAVGKASANWAGLLASSSANATAEKPVRTETSSPVNSGTLMRFGLPAVALVVLAVFLAIMLSGPDNSISNLITRNSVSDVELVRAAVAKLPFGTQVKVTEEVDGSIFASGYVDSLVQRRAVNEAVAATGVQVRMRLWARDVVRNEVASLIDVRQLPLTFDMTKDGLIVLKGRELDKSKVDELSALIGQQVVGVSGVRSDVETAETVLDNVRELARRAKVSEGVLFRLAPLDSGGQLIEATGAIRNDQIDAWLGFLKSYASTVADFMALRSYVGIEGQTVIVNNATPQVPGATDKAKVAEKAPDSVPLILASEKTAPNTVGKRVPLDMFLNNQTSYEKLLDAVTPSSTKTDPAKADPTKVDASKADPTKADASKKATTEKDPAKVDPQAKVPADDANSSVKDDAADTSVAADPTDDLSVDAARNKDNTSKTKDASKKPTDPSEVSLMQALGVKATADILSGDEESADAVPQIRLPGTTWKPVDKAKEDATRTDEARPANKALPADVEQANDLSRPVDVAQVDRADVQVTDDGAPSDLIAAARKQPATVDDPVEIADRAPESADNRQDSAKTAPEDVKAASTDTKVATPPAIEITQSPQSVEAQKAVRQLKAATTAILKLNNTERLKDLLGPERGKDVQQALDRMSGTVKQAAAVKPLAAEKTSPETANACWDGSNITPDVLPTLIFWLDLLSISENVSIDDLFIDNYGLLLEAGLSPDRIRECLVRQNDPAMANLATSSIYLEEVARNPEFIRFLLRGSPTYNLALAGANTIGSRYIQLDNGDKLTEGEAPSLDSRIASIGDLGVLVRVPNGYVAEVYPKSMPWMIR